MNQSSVRGTPLSRNAPLSGRIKIVHDVRGGGDGMGEGRGQGVPIAKVLLCKPRA